MAFSLPPSLLAILATSPFLVYAAASSPLFRPAVFDKEALLGSSNPDGFEQALSQDGIVQIIHPEIAELRSRTFRDAQQCLSNAPLAQISNLPDGTLRRTLAVAKATDPEVQHGSAGAACSTFSRSSRKFRDVVADATSAFVKSLEMLLDLEKARTDEPGPVIKTLDDGERLEHFRSYEVRKSLDGPDGNVIDFHTDQGFFIAFVPALMVDPESGIARPDASSGQLVFRIGEDGDAVEAELREDSVIFMLGDGINHYLNGRRQTPLAVPAHAVRIPANGEGLHRMWYGLMQLPPTDAKSKHSGFTFGEVRAQLLDAAPDGSGIGCSPGLMARELSQTSCNTSTQMHCWHSCLNFTVNASPTVCDAQGLEVLCGDSSGNLWDGTHGEQWGLYCMNDQPTTTPGASTATASGASMQMVGSSVIVMLALAGLATK